MTTLLECYNLMPVAPYCFPNEFIPKDTKFGLYRNPIGLECEVENYEGIDIPLYGFSIDKDGSLKNKGAEFISFPVGGKNIDAMLHHLNQAIHSRGDIDFSHRTSVHVHLNVQQLTMRQLVLLIATYACVERLFFSRTKRERHGNSFCYPLTDTSPEDKRLVAAPNPSTKYCALNVYPVASLGTVEFRHLHGTADVEELTRWVQMIQKLYEFVLRSEVSIKDRIFALNTNSEYSAFVNDIFAPIGFLFSNVEYQDMMEYEVSWAKHFLSIHGKFLKGTKSKKPAKSDEVQF